MRGSICIVSPGNLASNPRVLKEADALHGAGYDVTTVACDYSKELKDVDDAIAAKAPWKIVRVPRPFAERGITILAGRLARLVAGAGARISPGLAALATGGPVSTLRRAALAVPAELYIGHYIPGLAAAATAARRRGAMLGFDAEDFHSGEGLGGADEDFRMKLIETVERDALPSCAYVTAAAPMMAEAYTATYGIATIAVLNVFPLDMAPAAPPPAAVRDGLARLKAYWFSQTIGADRGLQAFMKAMARTESRVTLDIRGGNQWGGGDRLMVLARELGIADRVSILPKAPPREMATLAAAYDIGLSLELVDTGNRKLCLGNKIFTYLLAGVPVMMSETPAQRAIARELGAAAEVVSLSDPAAIAAVLDRLAGSPAALAEAKSAAWRLGRNRYNWDIEKDVLVAAVDRTFAHRGHGANQAGR
jgi:glycosyltransferase involved in cell wall biosynthesis